MEHPRHTLVVVRHAKAEPYAASDAERALTERGRDEAAATGRWLAGEGVVPDLALVSDAVRTRQSWERIATAAGWDLEPRVDSSLYTAGEESVLDLLSTTEESVGTVVVVGHNPTMSLLVQLLDDGEGESGAGPVTRFPTAAAAVFELTCAWDQVEPACARLTALRASGEDG